MMRTMFSLVVCGATFGCAGSITGEIDGDVIPAFGVAAAGWSETDTTYQVAGFALPRGDACDYGARLVRLVSDAIEFPEDREARNDDYVALVNRSIDVDSWYIGVSAAADEDSDLRDETIDLKDTDDVSLQLSACRQKDEAEVKDAFVDAGAECFTAASGEVTVTRTDSSLHITSEGEEVKFVEADGDTAGRATVDLTFTFCDALNTHMQELADLGVGDQRIDDDDFDNDDNDDTDDNGPRDNETRDDDAEFDDE